MYVSKRNGSSYMSFDPYINSVHPYRPKRDPADRHRVSVGMNLGLSHQVICLLVIVRADISLDSTVLIRHQS
jgi:hypothetical protein